MEQAISGERQCEATYLLTEASYERTGSDRRQNAPAYKRLQQARVATEARAPLWMSQKDTMTSLLKVCEDAVETGDRVCEGRLHQQPFTSAETKAEKLCWLDVTDSGNRHLGTGPYVERNALYDQARTELLDEPRNRWSVIRVAQADVRRRYKCVRAGGSSGTGDLQRALDRGGAIVNAGEHMAVKIDHRSVR
jgi:hypothetical protein